MPSLDNSQRTDAENNLTFVLWVFYLSKVRAGSSARVRAPVVVTCWRVLALAGWCRRVVRGQLALRARPAPV